MQHEDFIIAEILATGLVLGGVTSTRFELNKDTRNKYNKLLEAELARYPLYGNYTNERLQKSISPEQYRQLIVHYDKLETIPPELYEPLQSGLGLARYLMFAHITGDRTERFHNRVSGTLSYNTKRSVTISLKIHNLRERKLALHTHITASKTAQKEQILLGGRSSLGTAIQIGITHALDGGYPEAPSIEDVLPVVFLGVRDQLPNR